MKKVKANKIIILIVIILIISISLYLILIRKDNASPEIMTLNFESRQQRLEEWDSGEYYKIGWLQVQGTAIDLPIIDFRAGDDDLDYSYGWRNSNYITGENREVISGHNVLNVSSTPIIHDDMLADFEELMAFTYVGQAQDNLYIQYTKDGKDEIYAIYAIGFYNYGDDEGASFNDNEKLKEYIGSVKNNSIYDYDIEVNETDTLITLKTCTRYFGLSEKQTFQIDARKLRENEETFKYKVTTTKVFDELLGEKEIN